MTDHQALFDKLTKDRLQNAIVLKKNSMKGVKRSVMDKYSDQAHFIYELLQNADDTGATKVKFILKQDELIFIHNGKRHFSVTDPDREGSGGKIGDINAITSIGQSSKEGDSSTIGKFGVGFKAVFQYTNTPYIYDEEFKFRITDFIVPNRLENDHPLRSTGETLFVFPFDIEATSTDPFNDISHKLHNLIYPTLFLRNLRNISIDIAGELLDYSQHNSKLEEFPLEAMFIKADKGTETTRFLRFTKKFEGRDVSVCYEMDDDGSFKESKHPAFCFFQTKENTGLRFLIHAPFILTDSREGIKEGNTYNKETICALADLFAESLLMMRHMKNPVTDGRLLDETIYRVIPLNKPVNVNGISFYSFYEKTIDVFCKERIIPTATSYISRDHAYWSANAEIVNLFTVDLLHEMTHDDESQWILTDKTISTYGFSSFAKSICTEMDEKEIIGSADSGASSCRITAEFIKNRSSTWMMDFYAWMAKSKSRSQSASRLPIFIDQDWEPTPAFSDSGMEQIYLPNGAVGNYRFINDAFMSDEESLKLFREIGLKEPDASSEIENIITEYEQSYGKAIDPILHFERILNYYNTAPRQESDRIVETIKKTGFKFKVLVNGTSTELATRPEEIYFDDDRLRRYFGSEVVAFIDLDEYQKSLDNSDNLIQFFERIGINRLPRLIKKTVTADYARRHGVKAQPYNITAFEIWIDGLPSAVERASTYKDTDLSVLIWDILLELSHCHDGKLTEVAKGVADVKKRNPVTFVPGYLSDVRTTSWILGNDSSFHSPNSINATNLDGRYQLDSQYSKDIATLLGISLSGFELDSNRDSLTDEQKKAVEIYKALVDSGISEEDIQNYIASQKKNKLKANSQQTGSHEQHDDMGRQEPQRVTIPGRASSNQTRQHTHNPNDGEPRSVREPLDRPIDSVIPRAKVFDIEDYNQESLAQSDLAKRSKEKYDAEIELITRQEDLRKIVSESERYSYRWFKALLELEMLGDPFTHSHEVSIRFGKVEQESDTTILLKNPNKPIPPIIEEVSGFPIEFQNNGRIRKIVAESASVQSFILRVKLSEPFDIVDVSGISDINISIKDPSFLYTALSEKFLALGLGDDYNFQTHLTPNIRFIFGPPGTGKTTRISKLASDEIKTSGRKRILILAPTNKAADVIAKKIFHETRRNGASDCLVRFGNTADEEIEAEGLLKNRLFNIDDSDRTVFVTTVPRFYYDHISSKKGQKDIDEIPWDTIIVDESSMVRLIDMMYLMKKAEGSSFIVSGDPFQITPIVNEETWEDENIYSITNLNAMDSFTDPQTVPHQYEVERLMTQHRSIPALGELYSKLTYGGLLQNARGDSDRLLLNIDFAIGPSPINLIRFPARPYESIYRSKRLESGSCYHIYSALLCLEFVKHLDEQIRDSMPDRAVSIGVISPYKVQADLVAKMVERDIGTPSQIRVGTIHSFQGDECDIIILLLNTPPKITNSSRLSVNKLNIINVAISRARDYLYIMMPNDSTYGVENLAIINRLIAFADKIQVRELNNMEIEKMLFSQPDFIENNTYSTSHQNVNIYSEPEQIYEVRSDESSIDVQIHRKRDR